MKGPFRVICVATLVRDGRHRPEADLADDDRWSNWSRLTVSDSTYPSRVPLSRDRPCLRTAATSNAASKGKDGSWSESQAPITCSNILKHAKRLYCLTQKRIWVLAGN